MRIADLFAGAGGLSEGFRHVGYEILGGVDIDPDACATYALNFPGAVTIEGDLRKRAVRERAASLAEGAHVLVGGPPCQAFSQVRNHTRLLDDPRNALYREFVGIVGEVRPPALVMENVPGLQQMGAQEQVAEDLSLGGEYWVMPQLVDAADFGVPQTRKRLIFIGIRRALGVRPPVLQGTGAANAFGLRRNESPRSVGYEVAQEGAHAVACLRDKLRDPDDDSIVTAEQAIGDLAHLRAGRRADQIEADALLPPASAFQQAMRSGSASQVANVSVPRINRDTVLRLNGIPPGGNYRDLPDGLRDRYLTGQRWGPHNGSGKLDRRHYYAYRRLHPEIWAWTLNTKADSVYHYGDCRALSVREFARLQSFPDSFRFTTDPRKGDLPGRVPNGAAHSRYRQVGNAVPPRLGTAIAQALRDALEPVLRPTLESAHEVRSA